MSLIPKGRCPRCGELFYGSIDAECIKEHGHCTKCQEREEWNKKEK